GTNEVVMKLRRDIERHGGVAILTAMLDDMKDEMTLARYDAARALAFNFRGDAPDKAATTLVEMMQNKKLLVYKGTGAQVSGATSETSGGSTVKANLGGDARYMAADALGWMGDRAADRPDVVKALREATRDPDEKLSKKATEALQRLGK